MKKFASKIILKYLRVLTRHYILRNNIQFLGLTGSAGKTTLTVALYYILSKKYKVGMTFREGHGLNSQSGIPFAILNVHVDGFSPLDWARYLLVATWNFIFAKSRYEKFIVEMGVDVPKDMDFILSISEADLGIFLSISKIHTANFEAEAKKKGLTPFELYFEEKAKLIKSLAKESFAVINYDEPIIRKLKDVTKATTVTFGLTPGADVLAKILKLSGTGLEAEVSYKGKKSILEITNYLASEQTLRTLLAGIAVGLIYDVPLGECISTVESMNLPPGRMSKISGIKNTVIIDSSYNSSRLAAIEALNILALFRTNRKIAVLGDMREMGEDSKEEHEEVAKEAVKIADEIVTIGPEMKEFFIPKALDLGFAKDKLHSFLSTYEALEFIKEKLIKGSEVILIKGSQNTLFLEIIVEGLMEDPSQANKLLCRRGKYWDKKRGELKNSI